MQEPGKLEMELLTFVDFETVGRLLLLRRSHQSMFSSLRFDKHYFFNFFFFELGMFGYVWIHVVAHGDFEVLQCVGHAIQASLSYDVLNAERRREAGPAKASHVTLR